MIYVGLKALLSMFLWSSLIHIVLVPPRMATLRSSEHMIEFLYWLHLLPPWSTALSLYPSMASFQDTNLCNIPLVPPPGSTTLKPEPTFLQLPLSYHNVSYHGKTSTLVPTRALPTSPIPSFAFSFYLLIHNRSKQQFNIQNKLIVEENRSFRS